MHKRTLEWLFTGLVGLTLFCGLYLLLLGFSPQLPEWLTGGRTDISATLANTKPGEGGDRLFIPKIGVDVSFAAGGIDVLERGAWHRQPQNGDPQKGGNFVLSAHRFSMGWTPQQTRAKSPFYHIDKLQDGDGILVDYKGARYAYKVVRQYDVPRTALEIEAPSEQAKLTLYSCDLRGETAGRIVIEAAPVTDAP